MARIALLAIYAVWMSWSSKAFGPGDWSLVSPRAGIVLFLAGYVVIIALLRAWGIVAMKGNPRAVRRFHQAMDITRILVPTWLCAGIYLLHWGNAVESITHRLYAWPSREMHVELPQLLLGTLPAVLAWIALWWCEFPVERSQREQSVVPNIDDDVPVYATPTLWQHLSANFRLQVMFTLVPALVIVIFRDATAMSLGLAGVRDAKGVENYVMIPAVAAVFVLAPEILRRVLHTERLPDSPLRRRLEAMCKQAGLKYRDILLWRTEGTMANAAVMGLLPQMRFVLLSDLLLESMTDEQIEAVFAHELGHVVHKHLIWFGLYAIITILFMEGPGESVMRYAHAWYASHFAASGWDQVEGLVELVIGFGSFVLALGYLSPRFERQADVYAARTMQTVTAEQEPAATLPSSGPSFVGERGAALFASALNRVAIINHIPISARNWSHGSIYDRSRALIEMSSDATHTWRFDRSMKRVYAGMLACLCCFMIWAWALNAMTPPTAGPATPAVGSASADGTSPAANSPDLATSSVR